MYKTIGAWVLIAGLACAQILIGGTRLLYSIPACALIALAALTVCWAGRKTAILPRWSCLAATVVFCAGLLARIYFSPVEYLARPDFFIVGGALAVYLAVALVITEERLRLSILYALLGLAVIHAGIGAIQFKNSNQFMAIPGIYRVDHTWRASGFYISPNHYAGMLEVVALMAISLACWGRLRTVHRMLAGYAAVICLLGLALSGSRGGYLSFASGLVTLIAVSLFVLRRVKPRRFLAGLTAAAAALLVMGLTVFLLLENTEGIRDRLQTIDDSKNPRIYLWKAALKEWRLEPLWGTGAGTYLYYGRMLRDPHIQDDPIYVHNDYLHLLAEYGVAGSVLFLLFFGTHVAAAFRNIGALTRERLEGRHRHGDQLPLQIGALSAIAAYTVHSGLDFNLHIPANAYLMAWVFGMVANPGGQRGAGAREGSGSRAVALVGRGLLGATGLALLAVGLPKLRGEWYAEKARVALRDYRLMDARNFATEALRTESRNPDVYYYAGEALREMAEKKMGPAAMGGEAVEMFSKALELFPEDVRSAMKLAQTYDQLGQFDLAEEQLMRAEELDPNYSYPAAFFGLHYQMQGMPMEAGMQYRAALELDGGNPMAQAGLEALNKAMQRAQPLPTASPTPAGAKP